jgi:hypothetical protein
MKDDQGDFEAKGKFNRRNFLQYSSAITGGIILSPHLTPAEAIWNNPPAEARYWYQKPVRIMHTVLREIDARNYDADKVVDYLKKGSYNALCLNAGGIVDFFQNPLPAGNVNRLMGDRDVLKEITTVCKKAGIKVIGRIDFRGAEEHVYKKFPDWFMVNAEGEPVVTHYEYDDRSINLYAGCYLGKHRNEYANEYVRYVMKNYALDGIWHNAPGVEGICYCPRCKEAYKGFSDSGLPVIGSASEEELDKYMAWKRKVANEYMDRIKKTTKSFGKDKVYTAEVFSLYDVGRKIDSGIDLNNARDHFDILVSVAFLTGHGTSGYYYDLKYGSTIIKFLKSMVPEREAVVMYGGNGTTHRMVIDPPIDLRVWLWQILSAGGRFWNCYFTNVPTLSHDNRNAFNETSAYEFVKENEKILEQHAPVANIGIYYSDPTRMSYRNKSVEDDHFGTEMQGIETVLMENHIPHDFILDYQMSKDRLKKYKLVILPNVRCMSDKEIEILKGYVRDGGNLMGTYATSLYDENSKERGDYGLGELLGIRYAGRREDTRSDNYQYILNKDHDIVKAVSGETELLFNAGFTVLCKPAAGAEVICTWVPTIQNQPPDKSWVEKFSTEYPTVVENHYGKGKTMYFSNQPGVLSYEIGHPDPRNLLLNSIRYLVGDAIPVETTAPPSVYVGLTESLITPGQYVLSLVNTTSGPVRPIRELIPVTDIQLKLKLDGKSVAQYKVLRSQGDCKITTNGQVLALKISKLEDFCAVHVQMKV